MEPWWRRTGHPGQTSPTLHEEESIGDYKGAIPLRKNQVWNSWLVGGPSATNCHSAALFPGLRFLTRSDGEIQSNEPRGSTLRGRLGSRACGQVASVSACPRCDSATTGAARDRYGGGRRMVQLADFAPGWSIRDHRGPRPPATAHKFTPTQPASSGTSSGNCVSAPLRDTGV